jgi:hypothetical protein
MRRQTLILLPVATAVLAVMAGIALFIGTSSDRARDPAGARPVAFGSVSLPLPAAFRPVEARTNRAWAIQIFEARGVGRLWLSAEPLDGTPFEAACERWFHLPAWPGGPLNHRDGGHDRYFKPLPLFRQGALSLHKERKVVVMAACFDAGGHRHWMELRTTQGFRPAEGVFDALLLSLRGADGNGPGAGLGAALASVPRESRHRFLLPLEVLFLFPLVVLLLPAGLLWIVGRRAGRGPHDRTQAMAAFRQPHVEVALVGGGQWKFFLAHVAVVEGDLLVSTFGTPFLRVPRAVHAGRVKEVQGWFRPPYLELPLDPPAEFLKRRWMYGLVPGRFRLRVYTEDLGTLRATLGG